MKLFKQLLICLLIMCLLFASGPVSAQSAKDSMEFLRDLSLGFFEDDLMMTTAITLLVLAGIIGIIMIPVLILQDTSELIVEASGVVKDLQGNGIPGVEIIVSRDYDGRQFTTITRADGSWAVSFEVDRKRWDQQIKKEETNLTMWRKKEGWAFANVYNEGKWVENTYIWKLEHEGSYTVSGKVLDAHGTGIPDVVLTFSGGYGSITTGPDGQWSKSGLSGTVNITPYQEGLAIWPSVLQVTGPGTANNFEGSFLPAQFNVKASGVIRDESGKGIADVHIVITREYDGFQFNTISKPDGSWEIWFEVERELWEKRRAEGKNNLTMLPQKDGWVFNCIFNEVQWLGDIFVWTLEHIGK